MLNCYCPFCAAQVSYEAVKPVKCPKCDKRFADAFKSTTAAILATPAPQVADDEPVAQTSIMRDTLLKARAAKAKRTVRPTLDDDTEIKSHIMNAPPGLDIPIEDDVEDDDDVPASKASIRRRARELAASIDPATIIVGDQDEGVIKFGTFWEEGAKARASGGKVTKVIKRKARR